MSESSLRVSLALDFETFNSLARSDTWNSPVCWERNFTILPFTFEFMASSIINEIGFVSFKSFRFSGHMFDFSLSFSHQLDCYVWNSPVHAVVSDSQLSRAGPESPAIYVDVRVFKSYECRERLRYAGNEPSKSRGHHARLLNHVKVVLHVRIASVSEIGRAH